MNPMDDWDQELADLAREVHAITVEQKKSRIDKNSGLIARKMATIQSQLKIEKMITRIKGYCEREFLLLPKEKALLHWSQIFLEKIENYYQLKQKNLTQNLWVKLIKTRVIGPDQTPFASFDNDDLITVSLRHANLAKTEKFLGEALVRKRIQKNEAVLKYQQLTIAQENRVSATSMQGRLGINLEHAWTNPVLSSIGRAILDSGSTLHDLEIQKHARGLALKYNQRSASVLAIAHKYAIHNKSDPDWTPSKKMINRVEKVIENLSKLESSTAAAYNEINTDIFPQPRPKFVHNSSKKDKTDSPD